jgi:hypothetical protein
VPAAWCSVLWSVKYGMWKKQYWWQILVYLINWSAAVDSMKKHCGLMFLFWGAWLAVKPDGLPVKEWTPILHCLLTHCSPLCTGVIIHTNILHVLFVRSVLRMRLRHNSWMKCRYVQNHNSACCFYGCETWSLTLRKSIDWGCLWRGF